MVTSTRRSSTLFFASAIALGLVAAGCYAPRRATTCCPGYYPPPPPPPVAKPAPVKKRITLRGVNFDFDRSRIRPDAAPILDETARILAQNPQTDVIVGGHTDATGSVAYNTALSLRRAQAVRDYLAAHGVDASRLRVDALSELQPVATNDTADGRAQNRRVELNVVSPD